MSRNPPATTAEDKTAEYRYTMTIGGQTYQTFGVLSNFRAAAISTRATRVHKTKCVDGKEKDEAYAIKQCEVLQISEYQPRNCTSKVDMHGQEFSVTGRLLPDLQLQHDLTAGSTSVIRFTNATEGNYRSIGAPKFSGSSTKNLSEDGMVSNPLAKYELKKQIRVVLEDAGVSLAKLMVEDQLNFFLALADAAKGQSCSFCLHIRFH